MAPGAVHVAPKGAPVHEKETLPLNPGPGVSCRLKFAVCPGATDTEVPPGVAGVMVSAGLTLAPMVMTCGEFAASSVTVIVANRVPSANGAKATAIEQAAFTA